MGSWAGRTTTITVLGERWDVPRGFVALYRRVARHDLELAGAGKPGQVIGEVRDVLLLVGYEASIAVVSEWSLRKRVEASVYAATVHARAGDNPVQRHPKPKWLPKPWKGPWCGEGVFGGPGPTVLR